MTVKQITDDIDDRRHIQDGHTLEVRDRFAEMRAKRRPTQRKWDRLEQMRARAIARDYFAKDGGRMCDVIWPGWAQAMH